MWWISGQAMATVLTVGAGQAYPTISSAVRAANPNDTIEVHAGTYDETVEVDIPLTFEGIGDPVWRDSYRSRPLILHASATVRGFDFRGTGGFFGAACVRIARAAQGPQDGVFLVEDSSFTSCDDGLLMNFYTADVAVRDCTFQSNATGFKMESAEQVTIERSTFTSNGYGLYVTDDADLETRTTVFESNTNGVVFDVGWSSVGHAKFVDNAFCNQTSGALSINVTDEPGRVDLVQNLFQGNRSSFGGGAIDASYFGYYGRPERVMMRVRNNTFVDNRGYGGAHIWASDVNVIFNGNIFARGGSATNAVKFRNSHVSGNWNLFFSNTNLSGVSRADFGSDTLWGVDPMWTGYVADGRCNDDFTPLPGSPLIDAGDPSRTDLDGSRRDIGWTYYP
ncbi:MAG: right-handed parallel beta-helix repeat-containing protein [Myxococcales bacterium]|nr:right-handed parallel beta-helix repeat-containing protein [Myxococcales bacterium]MCA9566597.1 right-handed parallel beta-helix repeat-containing protein [Myxococcales bacterium]